MKKLFALLLVVLLFAGGCGTQTENSQTESQPSISLSVPSSEPIPESYPEPSSEPSLADDVYSDILPKIASACDVETSDVSVEDGNSGKIINVDYFFDWGKVEDTTVGDTIIKSCKSCEPIMATLPPEDNASLLLKFHLNREVPNSIPYKFIISDCRSNGMFYSSWKDKVYPVSSLEDIAKYTPVSDELIPQEEHKLVKVYEDEKVIISFSHLSDKGVVFEVENLTDINITIQADTLSINKHSISDITMSDDIAPQSIGEAVARCDVDSDDPVETIGGQLRIIDFERSFKSYNAKFINVPIEQ